jgi:hypothetical protein
MFVLALLLAALWGAERAQAQAPTPNYCGLNGHTSSLVMIDRTSPYTRAAEDGQGLRIAAGADAILASLHGGDRVSVATIEYHRARSRIVFDRCYPGCPPAQFPFPTCSDATVDVHKRAFRSALYTALIPLLENTADQPNSDVTGTLYQTAQQHRFNRVYLYSDMLENSAILPWTRFSTASPQANFAAARDNGFIPALRGATVQVVGFGLLHTSRHPPLTETQDRNIREFWRLYFAAAGASISYRSAIEP